MGELVSGVQGIGRWAENIREGIWGRVMPDKVEQIFKKANAPRRRLQGTQNMPVITPPQVEPPTPMPSPDDESVKRSRRRSAAAQRARHGRVSTIFTEGEGLGG